MTLFLRYIVYYEKCNNVICGRLSRLNRYMDGGLE